MYMTNMFNISLKFFRCTFCIQLFPLYEDMLLKLCMDVVFALDKSQKSHMQAFSTYSFTHRVD